MLIWKTNILPRTRNVSCYFGSIKNGYFNVELVRRSSRLNWPAIENLRNRTAGKLRTAEWRKMSREAVHSRSCANMRSQSLLQYFCAIINQLICLESSNFFCACHSRHVLDLPGLHCFIENCLGSLFAVLFLATKSMEPNRAVFLEI